MINRLLCLLFGHGFDEKDKFHACVCIPSRPAELWWCNRCKVYYNDEE